MDHTLVSIPDLVDCPLIWLTDISNHFTTFIYLNLTIGYKTVDIKVKYHERKESIFLITDKV